MWAELYNTAQTVMLEESPGKKSDDKGLGRPTNPIVTE